MILIKLSTKNTGQVLTEFYHTRQEQLEEQHTDYGKPLLPTEGTGYKTLLHSRPIALFASLSRAVKWKRLWGRECVSHCQG